MCKANIGYELFCNNIDNYYQLQLCYSKIYNFNEKKKEGKNIQNIHKLVYQK